MLKIKDYINLKELEKFGLKKKEKTLRATTQTEYIGYERETIDSEDFIYVDKDTRRLSFLITYHSELEDIIFDLIKAGLVEKVR